MNPLFFKVCMVIGQLSPTPAPTPTPEAKAFGAGLPAAAEKLVGNLFPPPPTPTPEPAVLTPLVEAAEAVVEPGFAERLLNFIHDGGPVMFPMLFLAFVVVVLIVERFLYLRQINKGLGAFTAKFFGLWEGEKKAEATRAVREHGSIVANMLAAGIRNEDKGKQSMREAMQEQALAEMPMLNRFMSTIAVIGTLMPIMGLLGTVTGMISTFEVITVKGTGDPKALAGGISEALITTETGLIFAIPILLFHTFLSNRVDRFLTEMEKNATRLLAGLRDKGGEGA